MAVDGNFMDPWTPAHLKPLQHYLRLPSRDHYVWAASSQYIARLGLFDSLSVALKYHNSVINRKKLVERLDKRDESPANQIAVRTVGGRR